MNQTIIDAINRKLVISFNYSGESRHVEPHCYGIDTKGHEALRAYQINKGWRLFHLSDASGLRQTGETFHGPRHDYVRGDKHMERIYAQL